MAPTTLLVIAAMLAGTTPAVADTNMQIPHGTFVATIAPDGGVTLRDRPNFHREGLVFRFDITDWMMRRHAMDPYAFDKLGFLDSTREDRYEMGLAFKREQLSHAAGYMLANIERAWASTRDPQARKQLLFELWDEVAEDGMPELVAGGIEARRMLIHVIHDRLGPDAYSAGELARLNLARTSRAPFDPDGAIVPPPFDREANRSRPRYATR
jgi:hypothetical protein